MRGITAYENPFFQKWMGLPALPAIIAPIFKKRGKKTTKGPVYVQFRPLRDHRMDAKPRLPRKWHGDENHTQWKPNYISVMNYAFQNDWVNLVDSGGEIGAPGAVVVEICDWSHIISTPFGFLCRLYAHWAMCGDKTPG
jgi:hypothetical protein